MVPTEHFLVGEEAAAGAAGTLEVVVGSTLTAAASHSGPRLLAHVTPLGRRGGGRGRGGEGEGEGGEEGGRGVRMEREEWLYSAYFTKPYTRHGKAHFRLLLQVGGGGATVTGSTSTSGNLHDYYTL